MKNLVVGLMRNGWQSTPLMVALTLSLLATNAGAQTVIAGLPSYERVRILESARSIQDVELTNQEDHPFGIKQLHGRVALILFGFTNCPDVCPIAMESLRQLRESGNIDPDRVAFVMISVDGERDTPAAMKAYVEKFSPDFIGLTGDPKKVKALASMFSAAFFKGHNDATGHYSVAHSPQIFVMDASGRLRAEFYNASIEAMTGVTRALLAEAQ